MRLFAATAAVLAAVALPQAAGGRCPIDPSGGGAGDEALSASGPSRICFSLDGSGYFRVIESGRLKLGMRWPGPAGTEFLGSGGLLIRFRTASGTEVLLGPGDFEQLMGGNGVAGAREGCRGGRRFPDDGCDDDGDGLVDEDPLDGQDNDGDGSVDEDFAAVGDMMCVTSAGARAYWISITRRHSCWNYGHIRDFIGFSTEIAYRPPEGAAPLLGLEILQYVDFAIGEKDDPGRGRDDRVIFLQPLPENGGPMRHAVAAAEAGAGTGPLAAVVIFHAGLPDAPLSAVAEAWAGVGLIDSLWSTVAEAVQVLGGEPRALDMAGTTIDVGPRGGFAVAEAAAGDVILTHRFYPPVDLSRGQKITIDWAIVFGKDRPSLVRNISRAYETWKGLEQPEGSPVRWIVPARKAARVTATASLAPVWVQGEKCPAVSIDLPDAEREEIEWLRIAGRLTEDYETVGGRVVAGLAGEVIEAGEPFAVEGQLTDGTIFSAGICGEELARYAGETDLLPGRLPEDSIRLFPNPFADNINIDITVHEPSSLAREGLSAAEPGISSIRVYDIKGRLVRTILADEVLHPGEHSAGWDGTDESGMKVAPGVYYCRLQIGERSLTRRVILLR